MNLDEVRHRVSNCTSFCAWPAERPCEPQEVISGWTHGGTEALANALGEHAFAIVEIGSWCGGSARLFLDCAPNALLISIDPFDIRKVSPESSPRHRGYLGEQGEAGHFFDLFCANLWEYRHRILILKTDSLTGIMELSAAGVNAAVELVYIDADHRPTHAMADAAVALAVFRCADITGHDWPAVEQGVRAIGPVSLLGSDTWRLCL